LTGPSLTVRVDLDLTKTAVFLLIAAVLLSVCAAPLNCESFRLATYYPSPSAVYRRIVTTSRTVLARDAGTVAVGTTRNPTTNPLYVLGGVGTTGDLTVATRLTAVGAVFWRDRTNMLSTDQGGSIELGGSQGRANPVAGGRPLINFHYGTGTAQTFNARLINSADGRLDFKTYQESTAVTNNPLTVTGSKVAVARTAAAANVDVGGIVVARQAAANCRFAEFAVGADACCAAGEYITTMSGHLARFYALQDSAVPLTGTLASGSTAVTVPSTTLVRIGQRVAGTGIRPSTVVSSVDSLTRVTMSRTATISGSSALSFSGAGTVLCCRCPLSGCPRLP
jgi:hypothetical protein